ncbi:MAG: VldV [Thermoleophilia bacterium]
MSWRLAGEYFENCNCDVLCPCITSSMAGPADNERCQVPLVMHIERGEKDGVSLDGLNAILLIDSPAVMGEGGWRVAVYIDETADESQRQALGDILSGAAGGPPEALAPLIGEVLGVKYVRIEYQVANGNRSVRVPGIMDFEVEPVTNPGTGETLEITGTIHPMGSSLPIARGVRGMYSDPDYGLSFDNTGKNGHFRAFAWAG